MSDETPRRSGRTRWKTLLPIGISVALLALAALIDLPDTRSGSSALSAIARQTESIVEYARAGEPEQALAEAELLVEREDPRRVLCHELYHEIGLIAGGLDESAEALLGLADTLDLGNAQCEAGYLHGILIAKLARGEIDDRAIERLCRDRAAAAVDACLHGAGHAFAAGIGVAAEAFTEAASRCSALERRLEHRDGECASGLAMEYFGRIDDREMSAKPCLAFESVALGRCLDIFAGELVVDRIGSLQPRERPAALEICVGLSGRLGWACRGAAGGLAANSGLAEGSGFLVARLEATCAADPRCLSVGISEAALLQGARAAREFCGLAERAGLDCLALIGSGLIEAGECELFGEERARCERTVGTGRRYLESIAPPPGDPGVEQ